MIELVRFFFFNPIITAINGSYIAAYEISDFHISPLNAAETNPFFAVILATYQPIHNAFVAAYN